MTLFWFHWQIVVWCTRIWKKLRDRKLEIQRQYVPEILSETQIQFHPNQEQFLVVNNSHLAIYEATELECVTKVIFLLFPNISLRYYSSIHAAVTNFFYPS